MTPGVAFFNPAFQQGFRDILLFCLWRVSTRRQRWRRVPQATLPLSSSASDADRRFGVRLAKAALLQGHLLAGVHDRRTSLPTQSTLVTSEAGSP